MLLDLAVGLLNSRPPGIQPGDFQQRRWQRPGMPHHSVLLTLAEIGNQIFRALFRQLHQIRRDDNQPKGLVRPKRAALSFGDPFDFLMPIGIRAHERLPGLWRYVQRQFLNTPWLVCGMPPRVRCRQRQHNWKVLTDEVGLEDLVPPVETVRDHRPIRPIGPDSINEVNRKLGLGFERKTNDPAFKMMGWRIRHEFQGDRGV
ncbi:hypothetical protein M1R55_18905 (plasmid) [Deinococcus sp. QL22]|nr:hypothetical protein [Deinococcus sp. QL22]UQN08155.1 hypothetical protein M1R55_18905 [Deinococcus sp. QL22]